MNLDSLSLDELQNLKAKIKGKIKEKFSFNVTLALNCNSEFYPIFKDVIRPVYGKLFDVVPHALSMHDPLLVKIIQTILDCCPDKVFTRAYPKIVTIMLWPGHTYCNTSFIKQDVVITKGEFLPIEMEKDIEYTGVLYKQLEELGYLNKEKL